MNVDTNLLKGNLDLILLSILEDEPRYGLEIIGEAKSRTDGYFDFQEGSLYPALHRLEKNKLLKPEYRPSDSGGPSRKYYHVTAKGKKHLAERRESYAAFSDAMRALGEAK